MNFYTFKDKFSELLSEYSSPNGKEIAALVAKYIAIKDRKCAIAQAALLKACLDLANNNPTLSINLANEYMAYGKEFSEENPEDFLKLVELLKLED